MKALAAIVALCAGLALAGCGGDDSTAGTESTSTAVGQSTASTPDGSASDVPKRAKPKIEVPEGPPPDQLVVRDTEKGDGAVVEDDDTVSVNFVGVFYKDGKERESTWPGKPSPEFEMDGPIIIEGWKRGLKGMRVGGRRELIIPSDLAFETGAMIYVVDLMGIE